MIMRIPSCAGGTACLKTAAQSIFNHTVLGHPTLTSHGYPFAIARLSNVSRGADQHVGECNNNNNNNRDSSTPHGDSNSNIKNKPILSTTTAAPKPSGYWKNRENRRRFFEEIAPELGVKQFEDWYNVKVRDVRSRGGVGIMKSYGNSLIRALLDTFPEHPWQISKFSKLPNGYWNDVNNHRIFFEGLAKDLGIKQPEDWYGITIDEIHSRGGTGLLVNHYGNSLIRALGTLYPEVRWDVLRFNKVPRGFWSDPNNCRQFLDQLAKELSLENLDHWYGVTVEQVMERGGKALLDHYGYSLAKALVSLYPEHNWKPWKFSSRILYRSGGGGGGGGGGDDDNDSTTTSTTTSITTIATTPDGATTSASAADPDLIRGLKPYVEALAKQHGITHLDDWYRLSDKQIREFGGFFNIIKHHGGLALVLKKVYPEHRWDEKRFGTTSKKATQRQLVLVLRKLVPESEILEEYHHPALSSYVHLSEAADRP